MSVVEKGLHISQFSVCLTLESAALIQVLMQVEEEEGGAVGMFGVWEDDAQIEDAGRYNLFDDRNYVSESVEGNTMKR